MTRFDRRWTKDGRLIRLPQEDFCQALSVPPSQKYQMDGGPGIIEGIGLLAGSDDPELDQRAFFRAQMLFWLLGATDGHAKNFSIALRPGGFRMIPLYDVLSAQKTVDDAQIRQNRMRLAMAVDGHYRINEVVPRHFLQAAKAAGYGVALAEDILSDIATELKPAMDKTLADLPGWVPTAIGRSNCCWRTTSRSCLSYRMIRRSYFRFMIGISYWLRQSAGPAKKLQRFKPASTGRPRD